MIMKKEELPYNMSAFNIEPSDARGFILAKLYDYVGFNKDEERMRQETILFIQNNPNCFSRKLLTGHVNGSAWIVDSEMRMALLTHHTKLDKWLQLGGHSDEDPNTLNVAQREAIEESGLKKILPVLQEIFDIDVHPIPEKGDEPEHLHYDIRFIFTANSEEELVISNESKDLRWVEIDAISALNTSESLIRMVTKTKKLKGNDK